ncbi:MAG TPA: 5-oxoprolinase subunit PxpB [Opitutus sp.]|nr:5-oxoprolinase subunit PxpB [Opitutus sp.]
MTFAPLGDSAVVVTLGSSIDEATLLRVRSLAAALESETAAGVVDVVPAYTTVTVFYNATPHAPDNGSPYDRICRLITARAEKSDNSWSEVMRENLGGLHDEAAQLEIPVCYGGAFGADIGDVAQCAKLTPEEVIELHSGASYVVHAVGFTPGFPYLAGLPGKLHTPRRATPRTNVPAGSVGIGGAQTGVYPIATPGGWQLIGRTPLALFRAAANPPALLRVGDRVKFKAITPEDFAAWK